MNNTSADSAPIAGVAAPVSTEQSSALLALANSFEIAGPDADGLTWLYIHGAKSAMFNLGSGSGIAMAAAAHLERKRRNAIASPDLLEIIQTIELGLKRGYTPADLLDENSPVRDRIRAAIAAATEAA